MQVTTKQEAFDVINDYLTECNVKPLTEKELKDWGIQGNEEVSQLEEWARDFVCEMHTEMCEAKNAWRYQH